MEAYETVTRSRTKVSLLLTTVLFIVFAFSFFNYLLPAGSGPFALAVLALLLLGYSVLTNARISKPQAAYIVLVIVFSLVSLLPAPYSIAKETGVPVSLVRVTLLLIGVSFGLQKGWHQYATTFAVCLSGVHAVFTLIGYVFPSIYLSQIIPRLPSEVAFEALRFYRSNLHPGITWQIGANAVYMAGGMAGVYPSIVCGSRKGLGLVAFAVFLLALLLTGKRGQLLSILVGLWFASTFDAKLKRKSAISRSVLVLVLLTVLTTLVITFAPDAATPFLRFSSNAGRDITSGRLRLYMSAIALFTEKPILGWGTGAFSYLYGMGAHNAYLAVLCENGVLGFLAFASVFVSNLWITLRASRVACDMYTEDRKALLFSVAMQVFFLVYAMTGNPLHDAFIFALYVTASVIPWSILRDAGTGYGG